jgi:homopolymeric O-antigen transport system ATP-binding protein
MTDCSITAEQISLATPVVHSGNRTLMSNPLMAVRHFYSWNQRREVRQIIRNISFNARTGDRIALIGMNGAGKTTLLRLLAGVVKPTSGYLHVEGSAQALLNITMGMQQDATGEENLYLNGLATGLSLDRIRAAIPEIVAFSELGNTIHDPVRTYSAGMRLRLAFSMATSTRPEIMLLDEWLSAGDQFFIEKAKKRLMGQVAATKILVLATHSAAIVRDVCNRTLVLRDGQIMFDGEVEEAFKFYNSDQYWASSENPNRPL